MDRRGRLLIGGAVIALVLAAGAAMVARGGDGGAPASAEQAVEAEIRRQGLTPAGACPASAPFSDSGSCYIFIGQGGARCSYAAGPPSSLPDRLIAVEESGGHWQTASVTRLDVFVPSARMDRGVCRR